VGRYHVNSAALERLFCSLQQHYVRCVCVVDHPYYVAVQYHPEYLTRPLKPSPPYLGLILAACDRLTSYLSRGCRLSPYNKYGGESGSSSSNDEEELVGLHLRPCRSSLLSLAGATYCGRMTPDTSSLHSSNNLSAEPSAVSLRVPAMLPKSSSEIFPTPTDSGLDSM